MLTQKTSFFWWLHAAGVCWPAMRPKDSWGYTATIHTLLYVPPTLLCMPHSRLAPKVFDAPARFYFLDVIVGEHRYNGDHISHVPRAALVQAQDPCLRAVFPDFGRACARGAPDPVPHDHDC